MEGWVKVWITDTGSGSFLSDATHASFGCIGCHGGAEGELTKDEAHVGMNPDPSDGPNGGCSDSNCHSGLSHYATNSVHATQVGYKDLFQQRSGMTIEGHPELEEGFAADCGSCHASCGDCHISQPKNVGGGLISGHAINRTPDLVRNCTACHGSRVGDEYRGANDYAGADVHWVPGRMSCTDCHTADEMHGDPDVMPTHRYEAPGMPQCVDCHPGALTDTFGENQYHAMHAGGLQCNVCHSQTYKSCNSCHVGEGITGSSYPTLKIGRNPIPDIRSYDFVLLRHIPVAEDTFEGWGLSNLQNYSDVETWKYTSPHNIRRWTAQTDTTGGKSCSEACHDTPDSPQGYFLRASDLADLPPAEQAANQNVIVPDGSPTSW